MEMSFRMARLMVIIAALVALAAPSSAQVFTGRIDVTVADSTGAVLPGVSVELSGQQTATAVTDAKGEAHFLNLSPGSYTVNARLQGFNDYRNENVPVVAGASVPLRVSLAIAGVATQVEVTADTPLMDPKKQTTSTNVTLEELQNIPSSRDPWVVMQTVPGIIVDRVNVGGAESGQQSSYQAKGAAGGQNTWNIDGIPITDMAALGASPTYYDFDMFQEMQVTTGGADVTNPTAGVHLNFVLKSGSNTPRGSTRVYFSNEDMQANNMPADLAASIGGRSGKGNRTDQYADYGFELGGPIVRDKLWAWGSWGKTDVRIRTLTDVLDRTILENTAFKAQGQATDALRASFTFFRGDKLKFGRGASATRPDETTFNQAGPTSVYKGEGNLVLGNNLFLTGRGAYIDGGFSLTPRGGMDKQVFIDDSGVWHNSAYFYASDRPQSTIAADGNWFRGRHEVKFGLGWRKAEINSITQWPGDNSVTIHDGYPNMIVEYFRTNVDNTEGKYAHYYVSDTISWDRLTLTAGVRVDQNWQSVAPARAEGNPVIPNLLPTLEVGGISNAFKFTTVTPRVGINYALDDNRRTLVRGSYAAFASQVGAFLAGHISPMQYSYIYYLAEDRNGNRVTDPNEVFFNLGNIGYGGFDPSNPSEVGTSVNTIGDYGTPYTHEVLFGVDRELFRNFAVSGTFTWRHFANFNWTPRIGVRRDDYVQTGNVSGNLPGLGQFNAPFYALRESAVPPGGGREYVTREGYYQRYTGFELSATKRMSNRWQARFGFSSNVHREYFDSDQAIEDPTPRDNEPLKDGGVVVTRTGGSGKSGIYMILPKYPFIANGLVQGPWGVNFGANLVARQGFGKPYFAGRTRTGDPLVALKSVLVVSDLDENRLPSVTSLDLRVEKAFRFGRANLNVDLDVFNVTNTDTVLGRQFDINRTGATGFDRVLEIMNPRILRLGMRINF
jgi:hypothetical protein